MPRPGDNISDHLLNFAVAVGTMVEDLPDTRIARHVASQFVRCGTAPAFYYAEARASETRKDFIHKLAICRKELQESNVCPGLIKRASLIPPERTSALVGECWELRRIIGKSISTAKRRMKDQL
jgi:four helix bundle protein